MEAIGAILSAVRTKSGVDFSGYRTPTVQRRIHNRMLSLRIDDLSRYGGLLEQSDSEVLELIERITIKVSRFYRNQPVFDALRGTVFPELRRSGRPLRLWSAGCGRGEEPYTLAMLLEEAELEGCVTATDVDAFALAAAAGGAYRIDAAAELPPALRERFLRARTQGGRNCLCVAEPLQSRVQWQQADLAGTPAGAPRDCDLICCRNVLIYWDRPTQRQMLRVLLSSLRIGGFLCLGEAEWPDPGAAACLQPLGSRLRIFRKVGEEMP